MIEQGAVIRPSDSDQHLVGLPVTGLLDLLDQVSQISRSIDNVRVRDGHVVRFRERHPNNGRQRVRLKLNVQVVQILHVSRSVRRSQVRVREG